MGPRELATPSQHADGVQSTGHAPTVAKRGLGDRAHSNFGKTGPRRLVTPHGTQTVPKGPATPPQRLDGAHWTGHDPRAARQGPGDLAHPTEAPRGPLDRP